MPAPAQASSQSFEPPPATRRWPLIAAIVIFVIGALIRLFAEFGFKGMGFDEALYRDYILMIDRVGLVEYPAICEYYVEDQKKPETMAKLPPTRFLYIFCGWIAKRVGYGHAPSVDLTKPGGVESDPALVSLHRVSLLFSVLTVGLCGLAAWRMAGPHIGLAVLALVAASPLSIHMGKHALVDGFFAFWGMLCVWLLWENLKNPNNARWLIALGCALALMVTAKENAFFVYVALCGSVAINRWTKFGTVTRPLVLVGVLGPLFGVVMLVILAGGMGTFVEIYQLLVSKAQNLDYAIATGDGPWFRYLLELTMIDPIVFILAVTGLVTLPRKSPAYGYLLTFLILSYILMCNVRYAMNMRYTTIWALPFATFAAAQLFNLAESVKAYAKTMVIVSIAGICIFNLRQYKVLFVENAIYEPVPTATLKAMKILKEMPRK